MFNQRISQHKSTIKIDYKWTILRNVQRQLSHHIGAISLRETLSHPPLRDHIFLEEIPSQSALEMVDARDTVDRPQTLTEARRHWESTTQRDFHGLGLVDCRHQYDLAAPSPLFMEQITHLSDG